MDIKIGTVVYATATFEEMHVNYVSPINELKQNYPHADIIILNSYLREVIIVNKLKNELGDSYGIEGSHRE